VCLVIVIVQFTCPKWEFDSKTFLGHHDTPCCENGTKGEQ